MGPEINDESFNKLGLLTQKGVAAEGIVVWAPLLDDGEYEKAFTVSFNLGA